MSRITNKPYYIGLFDRDQQGRHLRVAGGPSPKEEEKRKKGKKKRKSIYKRRKEEKKKERKKGTMNIAKLLHIKCCFFQFFNNPVPCIEKSKKILPPARKS